MADQLARMPAVKKWVEQGTSRPVSLQEFATFWKACSDDEKKDFALTAGKELGVDIIG